MKLQVKVGQTFQMLVPVGDRTVPCDSVLVSAGERTLVTTPPSRHGVRIPVESGRRIVLTFVMPDASYTMKCPVLKSNDEGLLLGVPGDEEIQRIQRREFVRVPASLPCVLEALLDPETGTQAPPITGKLQDISGGGCGVESYSGLASGTDVVVTMVLPEEGEVTLYGRIRRSVALMTAAGRQHVMGVEFFELDEAQRSKLVLYVNSIQREMMRARAH